MSPELSSGPPVEVLVLGLDPRRVPGPWDPEPVVAAIEAGLAQFAAHGVGVRACLVALDGSADPVAAVRDALAAGPYEVVVIGGGLRTPDLVDLYEQVVDLVQRLAPTAAVARNATPDDTYAVAAARLAARRLAAPPPDTPDPGPF